MPLISILTPAYAPALFLPETMASVLTQGLPEGWELEWVVQEDGLTPKLHDQLIGDHRIRYEATRGQFGPGVTRNLGLARVAGDLVQVLDHDDVLLPGALATLIPIFVNHPVHWAIGQADDLMPDGTRRQYPSALPFGLLEAGTVNAWAADHDGNWPIHCAGLTMRSSTLRALGGWVGVPADDDIAMFAALSEITAGYNESALTWLYRQHDGQTHRTTEWRSRSAESRRVALQRAAAIQAAGMSFDGPLTFGNADLTHIHAGPAVKLYRPAGETV